MKKPQAVTTGDVAGKTQRKLAADNAYPCN